MYRAARACAVAHCNGHIASGFYGYLKSVEHEDKDRYLNIKPQRADLVSPAGEVLYSVTL